MGSLLLHNFSFTPSTGSDRGSANDFPAILDAREKRELKKGLFSQVFGPNEALSPHVTVTSTSRMKRYTLLQTAKTRPKAPSTPVPYFPSSAIPAFLLFPLSILLLLRICNLQFRSIRSTLFHIMQRLSRDSRRSLVQEFDERDILPSWYRSDFDEIGIPILTLNLHQHFFRHRVAERDGVNARFEQVLERFFRSIVRQVLYEQDLVRWQVLVGHLNESTRGGSGSRCNGSSSE